MGFVSLARRPRHSDFSISAGMVKFFQARDAMLVIYFSHEAMDQYGLRAAKSVRAALGEGEDAGFLKLTFAQDSSKDADVFAMIAGPRGGKSARVRLCAVPSIGSAPRMAAECEIILHGTLSRAGAEMILRLPRAWFDGAAPAPAPADASSIAAPEPAPVSVPRSSASKPAAVPRAASGEAPQKQVGTETPAPRAPAPRDSLAALNSVGEKIAAVRRAAEEAPPAKVITYGDVVITLGRNIATVTHGRANGGKPVEIAPRGGELLNLCARAMGEIIDTNYLAKEIYGAATPDGLMKLRVLAGDVKSLVHRVDLDLIYQKPVGYRLKRIKA